MADLTAREAGGERAASHQFENVACPFCGLLCDDLDVSRNDGVLKVRKNGCEKAIAGFERPMGSPKPSVAGKDVDLTKAIQTAAALIRQAKLPLYGGLATDVEGMRAVMALAERTGGVIDHALSEGQYRNFRVLQSRGWITTTLTETRNRADLIVIVGSDVHKLHPRFFERIVCTPESMFAATPPKRTVVFLGRGLDASEAVGPRVGEVLTIPCPIPQVGDVLSVLRARMRGAPVAAVDIPGVALADIDKLAEHFRKASYGVLVWAPPSLDFPQAEVAVQQVADFIKEITVEGVVPGRFAGLSLGGNEGAVTAGAVSAWQSGYPLRVSFASGKPDYDSYKYAINRMLAEGEGDLLIWIASFTPDLRPPATRIPTIVLGTPGIKLDPTPAVFIPVGTPGADHAGRLIRCDNVVSLPLRDLGRAPLPRVADVLAAVEGVV